MPLRAYKRSTRKRLQHSPKFYLFDIGVLNSLERQLRSKPDVVRFGRLFEHFIILDTYRLSRYLSPDAQLFFWRTHDGAEVDLLIENRGKIVAAIEIKSSDKITDIAFKGLRSFRDDFPNVSLYVVSNVDRPYLDSGISVLPWKHYFQLLAKEILAG